MLIYDCEIEKAIQGRNETLIEGISYCLGWNDHAGMGISCIGAYDYRTDRYRVFCRDNFPEFQSLVNERDVIVGFNSLRFDNALCLANGIIVPPEKSYDILVEMWRTAGLSSEFNFKTHGGFGLDATCKANFGLEKSGNGALAPVQWQRGEIGSVIDYCLNDVFLTKRLLDLINRFGIIKDPRGLEKCLTIRKP